MATERLVVVTQVGGRAVQPGTVLPSWAVMRPWWVPLMREVKERLSAKLACAEPPFSTKLVELLLTTGALNQGWFTAVPSSTAGGLSSVV
jgi:hypothetical protein